MTAFNPIGNFSTELLVEGLGVVFIRGLTVGEYIDLSRRGFFSTRSFSEHDHTLVAEKCILGVVLDFEVRDELGRESLDLDELPFILGPENMVEIGRKVIEELTTPSDELVQQAKGYARYIQMGSDDAGRRKQETFDCRTCLKNGYYHSRVKFCGKFTPEEARAAIDELNGVQASKEEKAEQQQARPSKYSAKKRQRTKAVEQPENVGTMHLNNFRFPECPISWIPDWLWTAGSIFAHADRANVPFASGGLAEQPYLFYRLSRIISDEISTIEDERMKAAEKKNSRKK